MKNKRLQGTSGQTFSGHKRHSLQNNISQPYKIDWQDPSNSQAKPGHNKNFFQNMKNQLSSIKNDFERLIKKQTSFNYQDKKQSREEMFFSTGMPKGKSFTSSKRDTKKLSLDCSDKQQILFNLQDIESKYKKNGASIKANSFTQKKIMPLTQDDVVSKQNPSFKPIIISELQPTDPPIKQCESNNTYSTPKEDILTRQLEVCFRERRMIEEVNQQLKGKLQEMSRNVSTLKDQNNQLASQKQYLEGQVIKLASQQKTFRTKMQQLSQELDSKLHYLSKQEQLLMNSSLQINHLKQQLGVKQKIKTELSLQLEAKEIAVHEKVEKIQQLMKKIQQLTEQLTLLQEENPQSKELQAELNNQRNFYQERINQLIFHNQNFHKINFDLGTENQQLKNEISELHNFIQHSKKTNMTNEQSLQRKVQYLKKDIEQYEKRQNMFTQEIDNLGKELRKQMEAKIQLERRLSLIDQEEEGAQQNGSSVSSLVTQINSLKEQLTLEKNINATISSKYDQQLKKINMEGIASSLENSMNTMAQQNASLKSKVNALQADFDSLREQNNSYKKEIKLYEQRQRWNHANKQMSSSEWEELTQQIQRLTEENHYLHQQIQFKMLKEEVNDSPCKKIDTCYQQNIAKMAHDQLQQIQALKARVKALRDQTQFLRRQLQAQGKICMQLKQASKGSRLYDLDKEEELQMRCTQVCALKNLIFKVLIQKASKREAEPELEYYISRIEQLKSQLFC